MNDATRVFAVPTLLAGLSASGLALALFGDSGWDMLACVALATPLLCVAWAMLRACITPRGR
jgi:hypothetical protein